MMEKSCRTCEYWDEKDTIDKDCTSLRNHRLCTAAVHIKSISGDNQMVVCDASNYMGMLYTSPDHLCKEYELKEASK